MRASSHQDSPKSRSSQIVPIVTPEGFLYSSVFQIIDNRPLRELAMSRFIFIITCVAAMASVSHANKNFIPDWTFTGSSLADTEQLGAAKWTAQKGEVIGTPSSPEGGWLLFDNPVQDVQMATSFQCAVGCQAGLVLRLEKTADGFKGVFVAISD